MPVVAGVVVISLSDGDVVGVINEALSPCIVKSSPDAAGGGVDWVSPLVSVEEGAGDGRGVGADGVWPCLMLSSSSASRHTVLSFPARHIFCAKMIASPLSTSDKKLAIRVLRAVKMRSNIGS